MTKRIPQQVPINGNALEKKRKRSSEKEASASLPILPTEVIFFSIFIHLPASFLLFLRSLSRSALFIIDSPHFARNHATFASSHLIFYIFNNSHLIDQKLFSLQINRGLKSRNHVIPLPNFNFGDPHPRANLILAACQGLLLLRIFNRMNEGMVVANPIRKQWRMLPKPQNGPAGPFWQCLYGFIFDATSNLYKVVHLLLDRTGSLLCEVLTFGSGNECWRSVSVPNFALYGAIINAKYRLISAGQFLYWVNGHSKKWPGTSVFDPSVHYIMSMDVGKEEFHRMRAPTDAKGVCRLLKLGGQLSLLSFDGVNIDIWVLQDHEEQVWLKKHCTTNKKLVEYFGRHGWRINFELCASLHDGKVIVFKAGNRLFKYDLEYDCFKEVKTHYGYLGVNPKTAIMSMPFVHVNSLVWA